MLNQLTGVWTIFFISGILKWINIAHGVRNWFPYTFKKSKHVPAYTFSWSCSYIAFFFWAPYDDGMRKILLDFGLWFKGSDATVHKTTCFQLPLMSAVMAVHIGLNTFWPHKLVETFRLNGFLKFSPISSSRVIFLFLVIRYKRCTCKHFKKKLVFNAFKMLVWEVAI